MLLSSRYEIIFRNALVREIAFRELSASREHAHESVKVISSFTVEADKPHDRLFLPSLPGDFHALVQYDHVLFNGHVVRE